MKKKGLALQQITIAIISLVILGFAGGVVKLTRDYYIDKVENQSGFGLPGGPEFMPYQQDLTEEEVNADNSMKALSCAVGVVASDKIDWTVCPGGFHKSSEFFGSYGNVGVRCYGVGGPQNITLRDNKEGAIEDLVEATIGCWKRFENAGFNNVYCYDVDVPRGLTITNKEFRDALSRAGDLGSDLSGKGVTNLQDYDWVIGEGEKITGGSNFFMCGDYEGNNEVFFVSKEGRRTYCPHAVNIGKVECEVLGFEFMQKISKDERSSLNPMRYIAAHSQPELLGYFEGWPEGKEKFWQVDTLSMVNVGLIVGFAVLDLLPLAGPSVKAVFRKAFKKGAQEAAQELGQVATRESLQEITQTVAKRGSKEFVEGLVERTTKQTAQQVVEVTKTTLLKGIKDILGEGAQEAAEPLIKQIDDILAEIISNKNFYDQATQTFTKEGREALSDRLKKEVFSPDNLDSLAKKAAAASPIIMPAGSEDILLESSLKKVRNQIVDPVEKATKDAAEEAAFKLTRESVSRLFRERGAKEAFKAIASETGEGINEKLAKEAAEKAFRKIGSMSPEAAALAIKQSREFAEELGEEGLEAMSKGMKSALEDLEKKMIKDASSSRLKKLIERVGIVGVISYYGMSREASNEIFWPVGINSFGLDKAGTLGQPKEYPIGKSNEYPAYNPVQPFLVTPKLYKGERYAVASPCKANKVVRKELCECTRMPVGYTHYNFNFDEDMPAVEAKGIELNFAVLEDDAKMLEIARRFPEIQAKHIPSTKGNDTYIDIYLDPKKPEKEVIDQLGKVISKNCVRQKKAYPGLFTNVDKIDSREKAIVEYDKCAAVQFYMDIVNPKVYADAVRKSTFRAGEITDAQTPAFMWELYAPYLDMSNVRKYCFDRGLIDATMGWAVAAYGPYFGTEITPERNPYYKVPYKADCITVDIKRQEGWNDGINYCIDEYPYLEKVRWALTAIEVTASVALTIMTGGTAAPIATAVTGIVAGVIEEDVARYAKWPAYNAQGIPCSKVAFYTALVSPAAGATYYLMCKEEVPIANTKLTDAQISTLGGPVEG